MRNPVAAGPGQSLPGREIGPVTQTDIVRFAGAGGDFNPLHHDPEFARAAGFPGVLAMGQMHAGMLAAWLTDWCGVEHLREYEVRFVAPVFPGDVLRFSGEVAEVRDGAADLTLRATRGEDEVLRATARIAVAGGGA
ncbi:MaoC family dehydratase N-terminal domain-containing protein [Amycolatopsis acidiphila]|uniref:MaoC family dehydratase n=1 Tax=Amycolatopsis acidiphila TaxID=715473 RepID=UPI0019949EAB|nr:MaoC/PaaZ C-terminal domain-containing protein [Amycolatopsis acidiphila]UIJ62424.1 MaoC family dehydratase N-terminal domain-containing protein [Amycolatopsis acidiphila]GHG83612.1 MaoC-like dehydratase [Amycolatopsis acidiphila]